MVLFNIASADFVLICMEKYHNFERNEDHETVFLKWTDFSWLQQKNIHGNPAVEDAVLYFKLEDFKLKEGNCKLIMCVFPLQNRQRYFWKNREFWRYRRKSWYEAKNTVWPVNLTWTMSDVVKYRATLWSFLNLTAFVVYQIIDSTLML